MKKHTIHFRGQKIRVRQGSPMSKAKLVDEWEDWSLTD